MDFRLKDPTETPVLKLYHCMSARSFRPLWMVEELGLSCELEMLPFPPRALRREYLTINPLGTVPLLVHGNTRMTESVAICQYLCALQPGMMDVLFGNSDFGAYLNYLHFGEATLTFPQTLMLRYGRFEPEERRNDTVVQDYKKWFLARLKTIESRLQSRTFLCADRFTAADVSVGYALMLATHLGMQPDFTPAIGRYWDRLQERPAYKSALSKQLAAAIEQGVSTTPAPNIEPVSSR
jgi:glutathione S-transferase